MNKESIKKSAILASLGAMSVASTLGMTGCGNKKEIQPEETTTMTTTEVTTENDTTIVSTLDAQKEYDREMYKELAQKSYDTYQGFYDSIGTTEEEIEKLVKVLNEDLEGLTTDDVKDAYTLINQIILPDNLTHHVNKYIFASSDTSIDVYSLPRTSEFISSEYTDLKEFLIRTENARDEIYNAYTVGSDSDKKTAEEDITKLVKYEAIQYKLGKSIMTDNINSEAQRMLASCYEKNIIGLKNVVTINEPSIKVTNDDLKALGVIGENGGASLSEFDINLAANVVGNVDENGNVVYTYTDADEVAAKEGAELKEALWTSEQGKYIESSCNALALLVKQVMENDYDKSSKLDDIKSEKFNLLKQRELLSMLKFNNQYEEEITEYSLKYRV